MTKKEQAIQEIEHEKEHVKRLIDKYDITTVFTKLIHISNSGMYRVLDLYIVPEPNRIFKITWSAAKICGYEYDRKHDGLGISGCGMDIGFAAVYSLSTALYGSEGGNAFKLKQDWI